MVRTLADHQAQPLQQGRLNDATATGTVGSIVVGSALRWFITTAGDTITAAKYQVFNCQPQVPAASLVSELVVGMSIDTARALDVGDLMHAGQAVRQQFPFQVWALTALADAIDRLSGTPPVPPAASEPRTMLCRCHGVDRDVVQAAIDSGARDLATVQQATEAGTGCGSCQRDIEAILNTGPLINTSGKGRIALLKQIAQVTGPVIDELVPKQAELWDMDGTTVVIRLRDISLDGPPARRLYERLERVLKDDLDPTLGLRLEAV